ncbi:hypothetical protein SDC9_174210 [bioreactor metagenome]|uniref:Uncharacterized protein n=1 Tax=bioreactor metagenome TaxID=1076179 RepID=A0A645GJ99_9ZZZZ
MSVRFGIDENIAGAQFLGIVKQLPDHAVGPGCLHIVGDDHGLSVRIIKRNVAGKMFLGLSSYSQQKSGKLFFELHRQQHERRRQYRSHIGPVQIFQQKIRFPLTAAAVQLLERVPGGKDPRRQDQKLDDIEFHNQLPLFMNSRFASRFFTPIYYSDEKSKSQS